MKRNFLLMTAALMLAAFSSHSQTNENFNSRDGVTVPQVKAFLQSNCWQFNNFNSDLNDWNPDIEGDGAVISTAGTTASIYTPVLEVGGWINIAFRYRFSGVFQPGESHWIKVLLTNANNEIESELAFFEVTSVSDLDKFSFNRPFGAGSGLYKVNIVYGGSGNTKIAIDDIDLTASLHYGSGCNEAPVAVNDVVQGNANRTATGHICANDFDGNGDDFDCHIITNSPHGTVTMNPDKSFSFSPNPGFSGSVTTFTYQICDNGSAPLCSNEATVTINFPTGGFLPVSMIDFSGLYKNDGNVEVKWTTTFEQNSDRFEVERSLNGVKWETAGTMAAQGVSTVKKNYSYTDNVGRNTANKKDLYYRLKMIDKDGKVSVSRILVVRVYNTANTKMISVSPNPAKNDIAATVQLNQSSVVVFRIVTGGGSEVMRKTLKLGEGSNNVLLDGTAKLNPGMYVLEVIVNNNERMLVKLIKE